MGRAPLSAGLAALLAVAATALLTLAAAGEEAPDSLMAREGLGVRARQATGSFVSDVGLVVSSPGRVSRRDALWALGAVAATAVILANDPAISDDITRNRGDATYDAVRDLGGRLEPVGQMVNTLPYWAGATVVATVLGVEPVQALCLDVIESHLIAGALRNSAKFVAGRKRPSAGEGAYQFWKFGPSFPSGHTSVVFELATLVSRRTRSAPPAVRIPIGMAAYGLATCVAVERVDSGAHWPSDVFAGAVSGAVIAATVASRNEQRRTLLVPRLGAGGELSGGALVWRW